MNIVGGVDLIVTICIVTGIAFAGSIVGVVLWILRKSDPDRAVVSVSAAPGTSFTLRFTTSAPGAHRVWLRFQVDYRGDKYGNDYGITAQMQVQGGAGPASPVEVRIGRTAPALGPNGVQKLTLDRVGRYSAMGRATLQATAEIASLPATPPGSAVEITGRVVVADGCTAKSLLVFVVPT